MKTFLRDTLLTLIVALAIFVGLQATVQSFVVDGPSMYPTFHNGQRLLVNKAVYMFGEPQRGDVIVFHPPGSKRSDYIKRIIGLPGETVEIKDGTVYIHRADGDTFPLVEPYAAGPVKQAFQGATIPEGEYFVLGDNRNNSLDSRSGWRLPRQNIVGKAWLSIWPPGELRMVTDYPLPP